jgi:NADPH:quinone reductase-like Zn-dependent oxidoreductase
MTTMSQTPFPGGLDACSRSELVAVPTEYTKFGLDEDVKSKFKVGDKVVALVSFRRNGAAARYCLAAEEEELALKPRGLGWEEAASIPLSALRAWQAVFEHGGLAEPTKSTTATRAVKMVQGLLSVWDGTGWNFALLP